MMTDKAQQKTEIVYTRFDAEKLNQLRALAVNDGRSVAYLVRLAVEQYLNRRKPAA
ncbi:MAG: hypothetical protein JSV86_12890 [Gemmatimonadota bacterium]|nr:MAG: hypothetical protein JSV86_12890 [Gemmatimonadota bacterium]